MAIEVKMVEVSENHINNMKRRLKEIQRYVDDLQPKYKINEKLEELKEDLELCSPFEYDDNLL